MTKPTLTVTIGKDSGNPRTLTLALPVESPARAHALLTLSSAIVRGDSAPDEVRRTLSGDGDLTLDAVEAAYARLHASHGFLIGATLTSIDGKPAALDAVARGKIPQPACPACGSDQVLAVAGSRRCAACAHIWTDPDDARRYVGPDWRATFGLAVLAELRALGFGMGALGQLGAAAQGALTEISGAGAAGGEVSFS